MSGNMFTLPFRINTLAPFPYLQGSKTVVLKEGEANDRDQKKLQAERVILTVECFPKFPIDHVHCDIGTEEKNHLTRERDTWESSHFSNLLPGLPSHPELGPSQSRASALAQGGQSEMCVQFLLSHWPRF